MVNASKPLLNETDFSETVPSDSALFVIREYGSNSKGRFLHLEYAMLWDEKDWRACRWASNKRVVPTDDVRKLAYGQVVKQYTFTQIQKALSRTTLHITFNKYGRLDSRLWRL